MCWIILWCNRYTGNNRLIDSKLIRSSFYAVHSLCKGVFPRNNIKKRGACRNWWSLIFTLRWSLLWSWMWMGFFLLSLHVCMCTGALVFSRYSGFLLSKIVHVRLTCDSKIVLGEKVCARTVDCLNVPCGLCNGWKIHPFQISKVSRFSRARTLSSQAGKSIIFTTK